MHTADFDYILPPELIADRPLPNRADSKMLVVHRASGLIEHRHFQEITSYLRPQDLLVLNDTRVVTARFFSNCGGIELVRTRLLSPTRWLCMVRPGKKMRVGHTITIGNVTGVVLEIDEEGYRTIQFDGEVDETTHGRLALPHYMNRESDPTDATRYQTVYAKNAGAIAAPTAGLHFTPDILATIPHAFLTLHVGVGTFRPVKVDNVHDHVMHTEHFDLPQSTADQISQATRVFAVGTTTVRVLEHLANTQGLPLQQAQGSTNIFIYPPYQFQVVDALLTNFHLPQSTLLMLVCAFSNKELILEAYHQAIKNKYRFYSYGDCMLIL